MMREKCLLVNSAAATCATLTRREPKVLKKVGELAPAALDAGPMSSPAADIDPCPFWQVIATNRPRRSVTHESHHMSNNIIQKIRRRVALTPLVGSSLLWTWNKLFTGGRCYVVLQ
jgi:hypothetical protein